MALAALLLAGIALRLVAIVSWWPVGTTLADSWPYAAYAGTNPLADPQHPAGYSSFLAVIGLFTRQVAVPVLLQHLLGIAAALLLFWAVRRLVGSPWPALVPAAFVLLNSDEIFLEHAIMAEGPFVFVSSAAFYASVRAIDRPTPVWRWPVIATILVVAAALIRTQGLFLLPVLALALWFAAPQPWRHRLRAPATVIALGAALLLVYAFANLASNGRFEVSPATGWHLLRESGDLRRLSRFHSAEGHRGALRSAPGERAAWQ